MRITIGEFVICQGKAGNEYPDRFQVDSQEVVQVRRFLRAAAASPLPRGNTLTTVSFMIDREHASHAAACEFAALHHAEIPKTGDVVFRFEDAGGEVEVQLAGGALQRHGVAPIIGVSTEHTYQFIGGAFAAVETT